MAAERAMVIPRLPARMTRLRRFFLVRRSRGASRYKPSGIAAIIPAGEGAAQLSAGYFAVGEAWQPRRRERTLVRDRVNGAPQQSITENRQATITNKKNPVK